MDRAGAEFEFRIRERGITEPKTERVKRCLGHKAISAALHGIVRESGQLVEALDKGDGQPPSRIVIAEEDIRRRLPTLLARIPHHDDGGNVFRSPVEFNGTSAREQENNRLAQRMYLLQQPKLATGQADARTIAAAVGLQF